MNFSYWEQTQLIGASDVVIIGSGITGLSTAIHLKRQAPNLKVLVLERGMTPWGASSKNAGFACFGSLGEIIDDCSSSSVEEVVQLIRYRKSGLELMLNLLGKEGVDYQEHGSFELFKPEEAIAYEECLDRMSEFNNLLRDDFGDDVYSVQENTFGFDQVSGLIKNRFEAQIDTGKMMRTYLELAEREGVKILNGAVVDALNDFGNGVEVRLQGGMSFKTKHVIICSNGFAQQLMEEDVNPARAQVLITKPIQNLPWVGTFHYDKGYYYFRNIHNRVLFGGGRNLDFEGETTSEMENTELIISKLREILSSVILPNTSFEVDYSWAGVMGVGKTKAPIIKQLSENVTCGVRLGGMGVALGTSVGRDCAWMYFGKD